MSLVNKKGVDIGDHNGNVDFDCLKAAGIEFVMIKLGIGNDETEQDDIQFENNVRKAEKMGMPWGAWLYSYATNASEARSEVEHIKRLLKGKRPTLPVALDMEDADNYKTVRGKWNASTVTEVCRIFVEGMKEAGYYPMIYTGYYELRDLIAPEIVNSCDIWLAEWNSYPDYTKSNLGIWQYGGEDNPIESNSIPGVGVVDKNKAYKDYPTIIKAGGYNGWGDASGNVDSGVAVQLLVDTAYSLVNYDKNPDRCDIADWYKGFDTDINSVPCCCMGMMYLFNEAGALDLIPGGKVADCGSLCRNFYNAGQLYAPDEVKPGDLVIFSWSKERSSYYPASELGYNTLDHVEFCVAVYDDTIKCIGANNGGDECDDFQVKTRYKSNISCCCRPEYSDHSVTPHSEDSDSRKEKDSSVLSVQEWLNSNYGTGIAEDGIYGSQTKAALVKALQTELNKQFGAGLAVDGIYGALTSAANVILYVGAQGNITKTLQGFLICNGYDTNGFDGIFGNGTMNAVKAYQDIMGAYVDGIVGAITWRLLAG